MWELEGVVIDDVTSVIYPDVYFRCVTPDRRKESSVNCQPFVQVYKQDLCTAVPAQHSHSSVYEDLIM